MWYHLKLLSNCLQTWFRLPDMVEPQKNYEVGSTCSTGAMPSCAPYKTPDPDSGIAPRRFEERTRQRRAHGRWIPRRVFAPAWFGGRFSRNIAHHLLPSDTCGGGKVRISFHYLQTFGFCPNILKSGCQLCGDTDNARIESVSLSKWWVVVAQIEAAEYRRHIHGRHCINFILHLALFSFILPFLLLVFTPWW